MVAALDKDGYDPVKLGELTLMNGPQAAILGTDALRELLSQDPSAVHDADDCGLTALHIACLRSQPDAVELLIKAGASLNARDLIGRTPLLVALSQGEESACSQLLLDAGSNLDTAGPHGISVLWYMIRQDITPSFEPLKRIITRHGKVVASLRYKGSFTLLHHLANVYGPADLAEQLVTLLVQAGVPLEGRSLDGKTPLMYAVAKDNSLMVRLLLEAGANTNPTCTANWNILHYAAMYANLDVLRILNDARILGIDVDLANVVGFTPLDIWRWRRYTGEDVVLSGTNCITNLHEYAFHVLLQGVRDRTFQADVDSCTKVLQAALDRDSMKARELIDPPPGKDKGGYRGCMALRTNVLLQVKSEM